MLEIEPTHRAELSGLAKEFLDSSCAAEWETVDLSTPASLAQLRQENSEAAISNGTQKVKDELGVRTEDDKIAGSCLIWSFSLRVCSDFERL